MAADFLIMIGIWVRSIAMMEIKKTSKDNEFNIFIFGFNIYANICIHFAVILNIFL